MIDIDIQYKRVRDFEYRASYSYDSNKSVLSLLFYFIAYLSIAVINDERTRHRGLLLFGQEPFCCSICGDLMDQKYSYNSLAKGFFYSQGAAVPHESRYGRYFCWIGQRFPLKRNKTEKNRSDTHQRK